MRFSDTNNTKLGVLLAMTIAAVFSVAGCGDDSGGSDGDKDAGKDAATSEGVDSSTPIAQTPEECIKQAEEQGSQSSAETVDCLCNKCLQQMADCAADEGCIEIRDCSDRTGCVGTLCYFGTPECMMIIDKWGAQGLSTTLASQLGDCRDMMCSGKPGTDAGSEDAGGDAGN